MSIDVVDLGAQVDAVQIDRAAGLERATMVQRARTMVAIELSPVIEQLVDVRYELVAAVVDDLVERWLNRSRDTGRPVQLFGPDGFLTDYVRRVDYDRNGRPHQRFCAVIDDSTAWNHWDWDHYRGQVWTYHARWAHAVRPSGASAEVNAGRMPGAEDQVSELYGVSLMRERWRTAAAINLSPLVWGYLDHDRSRVAAVVDAWRCRTPDRPARLVGPQGFTDWYFGHVHLKNAAQEEWWPQFCPEDDGARLDEHEYGRAVWSDHVRQLAGAR